MKKSLRFVGMALVAFALCFGVTSCGSDEAEPSTGGSGSGSFIENERIVPITKGEIDTKERAEGCVRLTLYTKNGSVVVSIAESELGKKIDLSKEDGQPNYSFYIDAEGKDFPNNDEDRLCGDESDALADEGGYLIVKELVKNNQYEVMAAYSREGYNYILSFKGEVSIVGEGSKAGGVISCGNKDIKIVDGSVSQYGGHTDFSFFGDNDQYFVFRTLNYEPGVEHNLTEPGTNEKWYSCWWNLSSSQTRDGGWFTEMGNAPGMNVCPKSGTFKYTQNGDLYSIRINFVYEGESYSIVWDGVLLPDEGLG